MTLVYLSTLRNMIIHLCAHWLYYQLLIGVQALLLHLLKNTPIFQFL